MNRLELELTNILKGMYENAPDNNTVTMIHLFGIKYAANYKIPIFQFSALPQMRQKNHIIRKLEKEFSWRNMLNLIQTAKHILQKSTTYKKLIQ